MADLVIKNGRVVTPTTVVEANVIIKDGKISKISKRDEIASEVYDAGGNYVIPGLIDNHVHFRDFGDSYKGDWKSESAAAAAGGVTTVLDMPNNKPSINSIKRLEEKRKIAGRKSIVDFGLYFGAEDGNLEEIKKLENVAGVKFFLGKSTGELLFDPVNLPSFLKVLKEKGLLAAFHCEKGALLEKYKKEKFKYFEETRPSNCEVMSIRDVIRSMHGGRIHICHMTSDPGVLEVAKAKKLNPNLTCEVTPQHLYLTKDDELEQGSKLKMYPPLRSKHDRASLWHGLRGGIIDVVSTDHAPHTLEEKESGWADAPGGVPGVETRFPLMLDSTDLRSVMETCAKKTAEIFGIKNKGQIIRGYDADLAVVDLNEEWTIKGDNLLGKSKWTPFEGMNVKGRVKATFVRGFQVFDGENIIKNEGKETTF